MFAAQPRSGRGLRDVAFVPLERLRNIDAVEGLKELLLRLLVRNVRRDAWKLGAERERRRCGRTEVEDELVEGWWRCMRPMRERERTLECVPELAHVARPRIADELAQVLAADLVVRRELPF